MSSSIVIVIALRLVPSTACSIIVIEGFIALEMPKTASHQSHVLTSNKSASLKLLHKDPNQTMPSANARMESRVLTSLFPPPLPNASSHH